MQRSSGQQDVRGSDVSHFHIILRRRNLLALPFCSFLLPATCNTDMKWPNFKHVKKDNILKYRKPQEGIITYDRVAPPCWGSLCYMTLGYTLTNTPMCATGGKDFGNEQREADVRSQKGKQTREAVTAEHGQTEKTHRMKSISTKPGSFMNLTKNLATTMLQVVSCRTMFSL